MKKLKLTIATLALITVVYSGCAKPTTPPVVKYDGSKFELTTEPEGAQDIIAARASVKDKEQVVVIGRIGGNKHPWVEDRAAFFIVDTSLLACSDELKEGEPCGCPTPWDYCCESDIPAAMTLVQFVEQDGSIVKHDARNIFDLTELQTVVVQGTAQRDDAGNLTILADGMFVRK